MSQTTGEQGNLTQYRVSNSGRLIDNLAKIEAMKAARIANGSFKSNPDFVFSKFERQYLQQRKFIHWLACSRNAKQNFNFPFVTHYNFCFTLFQYFKAFDIGEF